MTKKKKKQKSRQSIIFVSYSQRVYTTSIFVSDYQRQKVVELQILDYISYCSLKPENLVEEPAQHTTHFFLLKWGCTGCFIMSVIIFLKLITQRGNAYLQLSPFGKSFIIYSFITFNYSQVYTEAHELTATTNNSRQQQITHGKY